MIVRVQTRAEDELTASRHELCIVSKGDTLKNELLQQGSNPASLFSWIVFVTTLPASNGVGFLTSTDAARLPHVRTDACTETGWV